MARAGCDTALRALPPRDLAGEHIPALAGLEAIPGLSFDNLGAQHPGVILGLICIYSAVLSV